jgi:hypothetical protein
MIATAHASALAGDASLTFNDVTASTGVNVSINFTGSGGAQNWLGGGAIGDFNRDGWQDIYIPAGGVTPDRLYINDGDGTFTNEAALWGLNIQHQGTAAVVGDYDNDGWLDIYVTSLGGPTAVQQPGMHRLFKNMAGAAFVDKAVEAGVNMTNPTSADGWGGCMGDYDLDGDLDIAVAGWRTPSQSNRVFRNNGDGTFTDVSATTGLSSMTTINGFATRFADMDGDRYPELLFVGDFGTSRYYRNNGNGTFSDLTGPSNTSQAGTEMGHTVADFNNDGLFDWYVTTISDNQLYLNQGNHSYVNAAPAANLSNMGWGWGAVAIDFNNDGLIDVSQTGGGGSQRMALFVATSPNDGQTLSYDDVSIPSGLTWIGPGRGLSNFDMDNDGDQDLIVFPNASSVRVFRNNLSGGDINHLRVFLDTNQSDKVAPHGIGSVIVVNYDGKTHYHRIDGGSNYLSHSELSAHFGLGAATIVDSLTVEWPNGHVTTLTNVPANQTITVEFDGGPIPGDADGDGDVDLADFDAFDACLGGDPEDCDDFDLNNDDLIDWADFAVFQTIFTGSL